MKKAELTLSTIVTLIIVIVVGFILLGLATTYIKEKGGGQFSTLISDIGGKASGAVQDLFGSGTTLDGGSDGETPGPTNCEFSDSTTFRNSVLYCDENTPCIEKNTINAQEWNAQKHNIVFFTFEVREDVLANSDVTVEVLAVDQQNGATQNQIKIYRKNDLSTNRCQVRGSVEQDELFSTKSIKAITVRASINEQDFEIGRAEVIH